VLECPGELAGGELAVTAGGPQRVHDAVAKQEPSVVNAAIPAQDHDFQPDG